jgi:dUTP pyrophosphatase
MINMEIQIKKLSKNGVIPTQGSPYAAGYDLYAAEEMIIEPGQRGLIKTNIAVSIPESYYGRVAPRSGLSYKKGLDVLAGVIDSDYRGDIGVILLNTGSETFKANLGDRIAQLIIEKCHKASWKEVNDLSDSVRSSGGFGSTGRN